LIGRPRLGRFGVSASIVSDQSMTVCYRSAAIAGVMKAAARKPPLSPIPLVRGQ
jgi:hypothetical protein